MNQTSTQSSSYRKYFKKSILLHLILCVASFNLFAMEYTAPESGLANLSFDMPPVETCESCAIPESSPQTFITGAHAVIYAGRMYDATECVTYFFYCAINDGGTGGADISNTHFGDLSCANTCLENSSITTMGEWSIDNNNNLVLDQACGTVEYGTDPNTGICGVKHDEESEGACYQEEECGGETYSITHIYIAVEGNIPESTVTVGIKYGDTFETLEVPGPGECQSQPCDDDAPIARDDVDTTFLNTPAVGMSQVNDTPSDDGGNVWSLIGTNGGAANGTVTMDPMGNYIYTPNTGYSGNDAFNYKICDVDGDCDQARVTITILSTTGTPLHVELVHFSALKSGQSSLLRWTTASESNNAYFEIQRANDNKHFSTIGKVQGLGNSTSVVTYDFTDITPFAGQNFYRLRQVDLDGRSSVSHIQMVNFSRTHDVSIFPNPTTNVISINLNQWDPQSITTLKIIDFNGAEVLTHGVGSETTELNVAHLPVGTYFIKIINFTTTQIYRFIKA